MARLEMERVRYPALDAIRLLAIIGVIGYHYVPQYVPGGFIGVDLFFTLSGFLMAESMLQRYRAGRGLNYGPFVVRRVLRLGLPLAFMLILSIGFINIFASDFLYNVRNTVLSGLTFTNNWWQIAQGASYFEDFVHPSAFTHLWYVALQMQLYLLFPLVMALLLQWPSFKRLMPLVFVALALLSAVMMAVLFHPGGDPSRVYYGTDTRAFAFLLGMAAASWRPLGARLSAPVRDGISALMFVLILVLACHLMDQSAFTYRGGMFLASLSTAVLLVMLAQSRSGVLTRFLGAPLFSQPAKLVYAVYLWYYPVYIIGGRSTVLAAHLWVQMVLLIVLAVVTHLLAEQWLMKKISGVRINGTAAKIDDRRTEKSKERTEKSKERVRQAKDTRSTDDKETVSSSNQRADDIRMQLLRTPKWRLAVLAVVALISLSALVGLLRAPSGENQSVAEMQAQIAENERKLAEQKEKALEAKYAEVPEIPGLSRPAQMYARDIAPTFVGDSILLSAAGSLMDVFPQAVIDGKVGRQLSQSGDVIRALEEAGKMHDPVVVVLGSNGPFTDEQLNDLVSLLGDRSIFFVNTHVNRNWQDSVNTQLADFVKAHPKQMHLIDWKSLVDQHPEWLYEDNTHANLEGAKGFANLMAESIYQVHQARQKASSDEKVKAAQKEAGKNTKKR